MYFERVFRQFSGKTFLVCFDGLFKKSSFNLDGIYIYYSFGMLLHPYHEIFQFASSRGEVFWPDLDWKSSIFSSPL